MNSLVDSPFLLPAAVATAVLSSLYVFSSRHRALGFTETALLMSSLSVALIGFGTAYLESYGWVLFFLWPFLIGAGSVVLYGRNAPPRRIGRYVGVASVPLVLIGTVLVLIAVTEGIFLFFAAPIACELMLLGIGIAYRLQERFQGENALKQCLGLPDNV